MGAPWKEGGDGVDPIKEEGLKSTGRISLRRNQFPGQPLLFSRMERSVPIKGFVDPIKISSKKEVCTFNII